MIPESSALLLAWHQEINTELSDSLKELADLKTDHEQAVTAARVEELAYRDLYSALLPAPKVTMTRTGNFRPSEPPTVLVGPLALRLREQELKLKAARSRVASTRGNLESAQERITELRAALNQLNQTDALRASAGHAEEEAA